MQRKSQTHSLTAKGAKDAKLIFENLGLFFACFAFFAVKLFIRLCVLRWR
jgi:hypothetical protein